MKVKMRVKKPQRSTRSSEKHADKAGTSLASLPQNRLATGREVIRRCIWLGKRNNG